MMYYGTAILVAIVAMLVVSLRLTKRSVPWGIFFSLFYLGLLLYHGSSYLQALSLNRPAAQTAQTAVASPR